MKRRTILSLILILALNLIPTPMTNADCVELKYDDGTAETGISEKNGTQFGVKFTLPAISARLVKARIYVWGDHFSVKIHVFDIWGNDLVPPFYEDLWLPGWLSGWFDVPLNIVVSGDFFIAIEYVSDYQPSIGVDLTLDQGPSYYRPSSTDPWLPEIDGNYMIHAVVCELPVGGELLPNTVSTIGTWIIAGISTITVTIGLAYKKRRPI